MTTTSGPDERARRDALLRQLRRVIDPELGINIVDLGLIYDLELDGNDVTVVMTLTTAGCPMQAPILDGVHRVLASVPWVGATTVRLVWEPRWTPARIHR
jgi:metal-sulfur cluster biosynthetic enzyme